MSFSINRLKFSIRTFLGNYPLFFFTIYGLKKHNKELFINDRTELVVSAYPRTANTFFHVALNNIQRKHIAIAHHLHVPALPLEGIRKKLPTVVLIRDPKDSIISLVIREPHISLSQALKAYINFYEPLLKFNKNQLLVAEFNDIINDFPSIIDRINSTFNLELDNYNDENPIIIEDVFLKIENMNRNFNNNKLNEASISRPSSDRKAEKQEIEEELNSAFYSKKLDKCLRIYNELVMK